MSEVLYQKSRDNKKYLIPDQMKINIYHTDFSFSYEKYRRLKSLKNATTRKRSIIIVRHIRGQEYKMIFNFNDNRLFITTECFFNGSRMYRDQFGLPPPKFKTVNGEENVILDSDINKTGITPHQFAITELPHLVWERLEWVWTDVHEHLSKELRHILGGDGVNILRHMMKNRTFAFQMIEIANDMRVKKTLDPTVMPGVLRNLQASSIQLKEFDWIGKDKSKISKTHSDDKKIRIAASDITYQRSSRELQCTLYQQRISAKGYLKYLHQVEKDIFRFETTFKSQNEGGGLDTISRAGDGIGGRKSFNSADDIRRLIKRLCSFSHDLAVQLFHFPLPQFSEKIKENQVRHLVVDILDGDGRPIFTSQEALWIVGSLLRNHLKISMRSLPRSTVEKVRWLASQNILFRECFPRSGDYVIKRELLGGSQ